MVIKIAGTTFSSDLRKPCWITGKRYTNPYNVTQSTHIMDAKRLMHS